MMKPSSVYIAIAFIVSWAAAFCSGYYRGGQDFEYLDHMLIGKLSAFQVSYCKTKEDKVSCYQFFEDINISRALFGYINKENSVLPISKYIFKDYADSQEPALNYMLEHVNKNGLNYDCEWAKKASENEYSECMADVQRINTLAKEHSNKSLKDAP